MSENDAESPNIVEKTPMDPIIRGSSTSRAEVNATRMDELILGR